VQANGEFESWPGGTRWSKVGRVQRAARGQKDTHALVTTTHAPAAVRLHELKAAHTLVSPHNHPHTHSPRLSVPARPCEARLTRPLCRRRRRRRRRLGSSTYTLAPVYHCPVLYAYLGTYAPGR
jgi:hypothetical protein